MWEILAPPYDAYTLAIIPIFIGFLIITKQYLKTRYLAHGLMAIAWFFLDLFYIFNVLGYILWAQPLWLICTFSWIPIAYSMVFLMDSLSRSNIDFFKTAVVSCAGAVLIYTGIQPDAFMPFTLSNGRIGWDWVGDFRNSVYLITTIVGFLWAYFCIKLWIFAPSTMKKPAFWMMIGSFFIGVLPAIMFVSGFILIYLGIEGVSMSIGALINAIIFAKYPKIIFILPFKVHNLTVISLQGGMPLYRYNWVKIMGDVDDLLFSGMIQGISCILNEAVQQGNIEEIKMSKGTLLIEHDKTNALACVLVTSDTSLILHKALRDFKNEFTAIFGKEPQNFVQLEKFSSAKELVDKHFGFIPE